MEDRAPWGMGWLGRRTAGVQRVESVLLERGLWPKSPHGARVREAGPCSGGAGLVMNLGEGPGQGGSGYFPPPGWPSPSRLDSGDTSWEWEVPGLSVHTLLWHAEQMLIKGRGSGSYL